MVQNFAIKIYKDKSNELLEDIHITSPKDKKPFKVSEGIFKSKYFKINLISKFYFILTISFRWLL